MSKFYGNIGYVMPVEKSPGVYLPDVIEKPCRGEIIDNSYRWQQQSDSTNDNITLNLQIRIIADSFASHNLGYMRYVTYMGNKWSITNVTPSRPSMTLTIGGVYNG